MIDTGLSSKDLAHHPSGVLAALARRSTVRTVARRAEQGYYVDRLIFVTYVEKSANTTISDCLARLQLRLGPDRNNPAPGYGERRQPDYVRPFDDHTLRPDILIHRPNGGVVNRMFVPTSSQLAFLDALGAKYFIVLRHPADQLSAMYTYVPEQMTARWSNNPVFATPWHLYTEDADKDDVVKALIEDGYLVSLLKFMADWLEKRDPERSMVLRFEDFIGDSHAFFSEISSFLYGVVPDDELMSEIDSIAETSHAGRKRDNTEARRYTRGPTSRQGIWKQYLTRRDQEAYRRVVKGFLAVYPPAQRVLDIYPDLLPGENS